MAKNFLYFAEADVETNNDAFMVAADSYLGCDPVSGGIVLYFEDVEGGPTREAVTLACANGNQKTVLDAFVSIANSRPHSGGFIVVADANVANGQTATYHKAFNGLVTNCTVA
tara:strand:+ start:186 stop:524 length:339 start_codon:yes stop_codon:yes gene_type:complete